VEDNDDRLPRAGLPRLELFFDLVFIFALSQMSHHLVEQPLLLVPAETLVLLLASTRRPADVLPVQLRCRPVRQLALPGLGPEGKAGLSFLSVHDFDRADLVPDDAFNHRRSGGTVTAPPLRAAAEWWLILPVATNLSCQESASARR
jgi:hypothetical protein